MEDSFIETINKLEKINKNCDVIVKEVEEEKLQEAYLCIKCLCNKIKSLEETISYLCRQNKDLQNRVDYMHKLLDNDLR